MFVKVSYLSFLGKVRQGQLSQFAGNVGQGQLSPFNRQCWTKSAISVFQAMLG